MTTLSTFLFGMCDMKPPMPAQEIAGCLRGCGDRCHCKPMHRINVAPRWDYLLAYRNGTGYLSPRVGARSGSCSPGMKRDVPYRMWEAMKVSR